MVDLLSAVTDGELTRATPCTESTVGDLIDHVDELARLYTDVAGHRSDAPLDADRYQSTGAHRARATVVGHVRALGQAWTDDAAWTGSTTISGLEFPNQLWGRIALTEIVVHGWDLGRATGRPFDLPEETLVAVLEHVTEFIPTSPAPDAFGPALAVAPDAALVDQIMSLTGRTP
jgi:uncharacterized protein (TIGR03086 family)